MIANAHIQASIQALLDEAWANPPADIARKNPCGGAQMWRWVVNRKWGHQCFGDPQDGYDGEWRWVPMPIGDSTGQIFAKLRAVDCSKPYRMRNDGLVEWLFEQPFGDGNWHILDTCPARAETGKHLCAYCARKQVSENERFQEWKKKYQPDEALLPGREAKTKRRFG